jgi:hypothetical protein
MSTREAQRATQFANARRNARRKAHEVLNPDERMIWSGYCESKVGRQARAAAGGATGVILAVIVFVGLSVAADALLNELLGIPQGFVLGMVAAGLLLWTFREHLGAAGDSKMYCRQQTVYALTNERVLVFRGCNRGVPVRSVPLRFIDRIRVTGERTYDRGTVEFLSWDPSTGTWTIPLRFFMVKDPTKVMDRVEAVASGRE